MKKALLIIGLAICMLSCGPTLADGASDDSQYVHRFWSPVFKSHFYTIDGNEANHIIQNDSNWVYEGTPFKAFTYEYPGSYPVYRFWSPVFHKHFYTIEYSEQKQLKNNDPNWDFERTDFYAFPIDYAGNSIPVYRFWSPKFDNAHFFTTDEAEKDRVESDRNWDYEGVAFRVPIA